jgi:hypothetical protein
MLWKTRTTATLAAVGFLALAAGAALAEQGAGADWRKSPKKPVVGPVQIIPAGVFSGSSKKATTQTEVLEGKNAKPMLGVESEQAMLGAIARYESIVAAGGWQKVSGGKLKVGSEGAGVAALKQRLHAEGYVNDAAVTGEQGQIATQGTIAALKLFQVNHGLAPTGKLDNPTVNELNVSAARRLATLRANLPRVQLYSKDLGSRYITVNIPALQLEAVSGGRVFSRHNIIAGKPERPSPVVVTHIKNIAFNPYWNVPVSIVERDLLPKILKEGPRTLREQNIRIFDGYNGPEVDPEEVDWESTPPDRFFFRQDPGADNAMASVKINFPSPFGVYMHDTPLRSLFSTGERLQSSGCVRVDKVHILVNWILNGQDGWSPNRIEEVASSEERLDVEITNPPQLRWVYLTAWANAGGHVNFRPDIYGMDGTGFVMGQPLPVGEYSDDGQRFILKAPPPKPQAAYPPVDDTFDLFKPRKKKSAMLKRKPDDSEFLPTFSFKRKDSPPFLFFGKKNATLKKKPKKEVAAIEEDAPPEMTKSVIMNLRGTSTTTPPPRKKAAALKAIDDKTDKKKPKTAKKAASSRKVASNDPKKKKKPSGPPVAGERGPIFGQD